jgi:hypothetical protein
MALQFAKRKTQNIVGDKGTAFVVEIWQKDYADKDTNGDDVLYPGPNSLARTFANSNGFILYWNQAAGWSWNSSGGVGAARHTPGGTGQPLVYSYLTGDAVVSGVEYQVTITIANMTGGAILVKLGSAVSSTLSTNGTHTFNLTANGTSLALDPTSQFDGDVQLIEMKRYFEPAQEFNMEGEGFTITWNGRGGTRNRTFLGSECVISYLVKNNAEEEFIKQTLDKGYNYFFIRIYKGGNLDWFGWVQPAFDQIENTGYPYVYKLTSTDSYGFYGKGDKKYFANEQEKRSLHSIKDIFCDFMNDMKITDGINAPSPENYRPVRTNMDWWRPGDYSTSTNPAAIYKIAKGCVSPPTTMTDENLVDPSNNPFEYLPFDVLNEVLKATNMVGFLAGGKYNFIQPNSLVDNALGTLKVFEYLNNDAIDYDLNTLEPLYAATFDNNLLAGSSLNYEPALKKVSANHIGGFSNFQISQGQNLTTEFLCGSIQSTQNGELQFDFYAKYTERLDKDDFTFSTANHTIIDGSVLSTGILKIRITDGSTTKYLTSGNGNNALGWSSTPTSITIYRGYAAPMENPVNNNAMAVGLITNNEPTNQFGTSYGATSLSFPSGFSSICNYRTKFRISALVEDPGISGEIYLEFDASNNYFEAKKTAIGGGAFPDYEWEYNNVGNPTPSIIETKCESITLVPIEEQEADIDLDVSNGIVYTASQNEVNALENLDLGNLPIGQTFTNTLYSFMYEGTYIWLPINGFQRGNPTPDNPFNATQLLVNEFLELQKEPLEILQGTIKSPTISPLSLVRYDYNDDGEFRYYAFLGGKFSAASETLTGEWYKISTLATTPVQVEDTTIYNPIDTPDDTPDGGKHSINKVETIQIDTIKQNALGFTDAVIIHQSTPDKIELDANNRGKVYDNQKLVLTYPDGSRPMILTVNGNQETTSDQVNVDPFTPKISYPIGSILSTLVYDFTNVITAGSGTPNLYQGITTQYIYLKPDDFLTTSGTTFKMYTRDNAASVQPSAYVNRTSVFASFWTPAGYQVTAVDVYGANNRTFNLKEGVHSSSSSVNIQTGGTMNTTMTLTTAYTFVVGKYGIIEVQFGSTGDKIYGARITIQEI